MVVPFLKSLSIYSIRETTMTAQKQIFQLGYIKTFKTKIQIRLQSVQSDQSSLFQLPNKCREDDQMHRLIRDFAGRTVFCTFCRPSFFFQCWLISRIKCDQKQ